MVCPLRAFCFHNHRQRPVRRADNLPEAAFIFRTADDRIGPGKVGDGIDRGLPTGHRSTVILHHDTQERKSLFIHIDQGIEA